MTPNHKEEKEVTDAELYARFNKLAFYVAWAMQRKYNLNEGDVEDIAQCRP